MEDLHVLLKTYIRERPLFLSLIRAKEAYLYQKYLPLRSPILDIGCGDGYFAKVAFTKKSRAKILPARSGEKSQVIDVGLDVKDSRIEEARRLGVYKKVVTYDGKKMPFVSNSFETIVSNSVLEHVEHLDVVLKEIYRVLAIDGTFLTTTIAKPWEEYLFGAKLLGDAYKNWIRKKQVHVNLYTKTQWDKAFSKVGFKVTKTIGHLNSASCGLIDVFHYSSALSLLWYKLFKKWVLLPSVAEKIYPLRIFERIISKNIDPTKSGALFYELKKK